MKLIRYVKFVGVGLLALGIYFALVVYVPQPQGTALSILRGVLLLVAVPCLIVGAAGCAIESIRNSIETIREAVKQIRGE